MDKVVRKIKIVGIVINLLELKNAPYKITMDGNKIHEGSWANCDVFFDGLAFGLVTLAPLIDKEYLRDVEVKRG